MSAETQAKRFLTVREVAASGVLSEHHLRLMIKEGKVPGIYTGNRFMVNVPLFLAQLDALSRGEAGG